MKAEVVEQTNNGYRDLSGRLVVVSGGASGIGAAVVRAFHAAAARVAFLDNDAAAGQSLAEELGSGGFPRFMPCDLRDITALRGALAALQDEAGPVSVLVNNAARDDRHTLEAVTPESWDACLAVNLRHHPFAIQAVATGMAEAGGGSIVNLESVAWRRAQPAMVGYHAAKAAILGMTRALARELGPSGIRVNCVAPGAVETERQKRLWLDPEKERRILELQALKFRLQGEDIARVVLFLASDQSRCITGQSIVADAGFTLN